MMDSPGGALLFAAALIATNAALLRLQRRITQETPRRPFAEALAPAGITTAALHILMLLSAKSSGEVLAWLPVSAAVSLATNLFIARILIAIRD